MVHALRLRDQITHQYLICLLLPVPSPDLSFQPGEHLEVYVSASENPQHFWIQIIGVRSLQLDKLTTEMSRFFNGDTLHVSLVHFYLFQKSIILTHVGN